MCSLYLPQNTPSLERHLPLQQPSLDFSFQILEYIKKVLQTTLFACIFAERYTTTTTQHHRAKQRLIIIKGLMATISAISSNVFSLKVRLEVCT